MSRADSANVESVDAALGRQEVFRDFNQRFNDIESGFDNLKATVPPHAQDWWHEREPKVDAKLAYVRKELNDISHDLSELLAPLSAALDGQLTHLELELAKAREDLGARTAAGPGKENL